MAQLDGFSVDPRIFRELGALLVKSDSIALTELLKNSYDADATEVAVSGHLLDVPGAGTIHVRDNGVGMTADEFARGFLRIATRSKETDDRRSRILGRHYTGEKGIGRLSAHRLGAQLAVLSAPLDDQANRTSRELLTANLDWAAIEESESLSGLPSYALSVEQTRTRKPSPSGTTLILKQLRETWDSRKIEDFVVEADLFEPPNALIKPVHTLVGRRLLFARPKLRDSRTEEDRFVVTFDGDLDIGEGLWGEIPKASWWVIEIDATPERATFVVAPTHRAREDNPDADVVEGELGPDRRRPTFQARIFAREGVRSQRERDFASKVAGVRVYMEGFRISPYGEPHDDWLNLDGDYARREAKLALRFEGQLAGQEIAREGLRTLPNRSYAGAVLLTHRGAPALEAPVDREGFLPSVQLDALSETVRTGIDLLTRVRAQLGFASRVQDDARRIRRREVGQGFLVDEIFIRDGLETAVATARELHGPLAAGRVDVASLDGLIAELETLSAAAERSVEDRSLLRVLAGAGTQMAAFVHEIHNVVSATATLDATLAQLADEHPHMRTALDTVRRNLNAVQRQVERQASYLTDVATVEARRRRQRQNIGERLESAWRLVQPAADRLEIQFENFVNQKSRTPPMFRAEVAAILTNLMTNAVKAAGPGGAIVATSGQSDAGTWLRIENTGRRVDIKTSERWFLPFESTSLDRLDPLLGQGMGLGLAIVRSMLGDYGASIRFAEPIGPGMETAILVTFR